MKSQHSSNTTVFTISGAAEEIKRPRQTISQWIKAGMIVPSARIDGPDGQPAFSESDMTKLRQLDEQRKALESARKLPKPTFHLRTSDRKQ